MKVAPARADTRDPIAVLRVALHQDNNGHFFCEVTTAFPGVSDTFWTATYSEPQEAIKDALERSVVRALGSEAIR